MKNNEEETKTVQKIVEIKSLDDRINDLIEMGKEKKYVTFEQIVELSLIHISEPTRH